jgi:hypothetical protein
LLERYFDDLTVRFREDVKANTERDIDNEPIDLLLVSGRIDNCAMRPSTKPRARLLYVPRRRLRARTARPSIRPSRTNDSTALAPAERK